VVNLFCVVTVLNAVPSQVDIS